jgi:hypothetical protein
MRSYYNTVIRVVGIHCSDHATLSTHKSWQYFAGRGGRLYDIRVVRFRTKSQGGFAYHTSCITRPYDLNSLDFEIFIGEYMSQNSSVFTFLQCQYSIFQDKYEHISE